MPRVLPLLAPMLWLPLLACDEPREIDGLPIQVQEALSPPVVAAPIHDCAGAVRVYSFVPGATVRVWVNAGELVGEKVVGSNLEADGTVSLTRPLAIGERITATQTVNGVESEHSIEPVLVEPYTELLRPRVDDRIVECGEIVPVFEVTPSAVVKVLSLDAAGERVELGRANATGTSVAVRVPPLGLGQEVWAEQWACEGGPAELVSQESGRENADPRPGTVPTPGIDSRSLVVGNDRVDLSGLLIGASLDVRDGATPIGGGLANAPENWVPLSRALVRTSSVSAAQSLCGEPSQTITSDDIRDRLDAPRIAGPFCGDSRHVLPPDARYVDVDDSVVNATLAVSRRVGGARTPVGYSGAMPGTVRVWFDPDTALNPGERLAVTQAMGPTVSPPSPEVAVAACPCVGVGEQTCTADIDCCPGSSCRDGTCWEDCDSGQGCTVEGAQGECRDGTWDCSQPDAVCRGGAPRVEVCEDRRDNDCDGSTDEGCNLRGDLRVYVSTFTVVGQDTPTASSRSCVRGTIVNVWVYEHGTTRPLIPSDTLTCATSIDHTFTGLNASRTWDVHIEWTRDRSTTGAEDLTCPPGGAALTAGGTTRVDFLVNDAAGPRCLP